MGVTRASAALSSGDFRAAVPDFPPRQSRFPTPSFPRRRESGKACGRRGTPASAICQRALVRIRIFGMIGFSGFHYRIFAWQALAPTPLVGIFGYGENRKPGESKSRKSRQSRKTPILTKTPSRLHPPSSPRKRKPKRRRTISHSSLLSLLSQNRTPTPLPPNRSRVL